MTTTDFNPILLVLAREARGHSQSALSQLVGVTQGALSKIENGIVTPSPELVDRFASILNEPVSFFSQTVRYQQLPVTFFRRKSRLGTREVRAIRAKINLYRMRLEILLRSTEMRDPKLVLVDLAKQGKTPEQAATLLRTYWNLPPGPLLNLTDFVEKAGVLIIPFDFDSPLVDGLALYEPNDTLPPMIFLNPKMPGDRWRWTLAHELGHVVLHHHLPIPPDEKDMEKEAHRFASELLLPQQAVWAHLGNLTLARLAQLKRVWRVSMRSLLTRAVDLKRISERQAKYLWMQLSRQGGTTEPVEVEREHPGRLRDLVGNHLSDLGYSLRELSGLLHQPLDEFRSDFVIQTSYLRLA